MVKGKRCLLAFCGLALLLALVIVDILCGDSAINVLHPTEAQSLILWKLRIPRALTAMLAGAALSLSGLQMQAIFRNPLADPHIMGVSSGASFAAALVTAVLPSAMMGSFVAGMSLAMAAFVGAVLVSLLIVAVSTRISSANTLLILGVMIGYVLSACTTIVEYSSSERALRTFYNWSAGSFTSTSWMQIALVAVLAAVGAVLVAINAKGLDAVLFGDEYARSTGADVKKVRVVSMLSCCLLTGVVTAFCGPLGFVGIIGPHIARRLLRTSVHKRIIVASAIVGGAIALIADILSVVVKSPLPVGSTMAIVGIPVVIYIILHSRESA